MTSQEFSTWYNRAALLFDEVGRFVDKRQHQKADLLAEWQRILASTDLIDANTVLDGMSNGQIERPEWDFGRFPGIVVREAKSHKQGRMAHERAKSRRYSAEQRFRCLVCQDRGIVNVWNPEFVEAYRGEFSKVKAIVVDRKDSTICDRFDPEKQIDPMRYDPPNWLAEASRWWRGLRDDAGPIHHVALCHCDCERQCVLAREQRAFYVERKRTLGNRQLGAPSCGAATYNPRTMPLKTAMSYDDLGSWYATHSANHDAVFVPTEDDYAKYFG